MQWPGTTEGHRNDAALLSARGGKQALETPHPTSPGLGNIGSKEKHSPDLAFLIARRLRSLFRWLIGGLRWSLTVEKAGDVGEARMNRAWSAMDTAAKPSARLRAADPDQNGDVEITLAGIVQRRSQVDHATAWDGTI